MKAWIKDLFKPKIKMDGFDLNKWHYLGYSEISYKFKDGAIPSKIKFFANKKNLQNRKFVFEFKNLKAIGINFHNHQYVLTYVIPWAQNSYPLAKPINRQPSPWLEEYMLKDGWCWDDDQWVKTDQPKRTEPTRVGNVITIDFKK